MWGALVEVHLFEETINIDGCGVNFQIDWYFLLLEEFFKLRFL